MGWVKAELAPLKEQAERENWVANGTKWAIITLTFSIIGAYCVPYLMNMLLVKAEMEPVATAMAGFLIGGTLVNLEKFGRFWFVPALCMVGYVVIDLNMIEAVKGTIDTIMASALD